MNEKRKEAERERKLDVCQTIGKQKNKIICACNTIVHFEFYGAV